MDMNKKMGIKRLKKNLLNREKNARRYAAILRECIQAYFLAKVSI